MSAPNRSTKKPAQGLWKLVLRTELTGLLRDRRALFAGLVLPALLYPFLFLGQGWLKDIAEETLNSREVRVAMELSQAPPLMRERLEELLALEIPITLERLPEGATRSLDEVLQEETPASWMREGELAEDLMGTENNLLLYAVPDPVTPRRTLFRLHFDGAQENSREALKRVRKALDALRMEHRQARFEENFGGDPAANLVSRELDLASKENLGGALLGRLLPLIAVMVLLSGGSYAALAAFAGERESGTLETLLVQPIESRAIVLGKFLAVLMSALATLVLNTGSLLLSVGLGLGSLPGAGEAVGQPALLRILAGGLLLLPVCLFLVSVLCLVCGKARSFREGQHYILPLSLLTLLPAALALQPEIQLDAFLACVPIAGPALAFRDLMIGQLALVPGSLAVSSTLLYSWFALRRIGNLLDAEKVLASQSTSEEQSLRKEQSRSALTWGWAGVLGVYTIGGLMQTFHPLYGLLGTLWLLLPVAAYFCVKQTAKRAAESIPRALGLRLPAAHHTLGVMLAAPALAQLAQTWFKWQAKVLPLPSSMTDADSLPVELTQLSGISMFLVFALTPGICEELFFRGAVLSGLKRDLAPWKSVLWQALLFGAVHASIYRFAPTALLGGLLAAITLRSRSLFPAMLLHTAYNGTLILATESIPWLEAAWVPWLLVPAAALLALPARRRAGD
ncbi:MAG: sodium transport system permease protein [Candidatus Paceibacteria bacterium]